MLAERERGGPAGLEARSCLLCACAFSIAVACLNNISAALTALLISCGVFPLAWKRRLHIARRLFAANVFILFLWLVTPFTAPGEIIWRWGLLSASREGTRLALMATIKANALVLVFVALVASLPVSSLGAALRGLRCPDKLTWMFLLMERNIGVLREEWVKLREAARLRCFQPKNNLHTYRALGSLLGLFLIRAVERSHILYEALLLRGYDGSLPFRQTSPFRVRDYVLWLCCLVSILLVLAVEYGVIHVPG